MNRKPGIFLAAVLLLAGGERLCAFSVYLQSDVVVETFPVLLKHVARVEGGGAKDPRGQVLFETLRSPVYLTREDLIKRLGTDRTDTVYGSGTWIVPAVEKLTAKDIRALLERSISALPGGPEFLKTAEIRISPSETIKSTPEGTNLIFRLPSRASALSAGKRVIPVDLTVEKKNLFRQSLNVEIIRRAEVFVAVRDLEVGERLTKDDFRTEVREFDHEDIPKLPLPLHRRVMARIPAGNMLTAASVQVLPAVRRGENVELVLQRPGIIIKVRSTAQSDGNVGDVVNFRMNLPATNRSVDAKGRIVSEGIAEFQGKGHE